MDTRRKLEARVAELEQRLEAIEHRHRDEDEADAIASYQFERLKAAFNALSSTGRQTDKPEPLPDQEIAPTKPC